MLTRDRLVPDKVEDEPSLDFPERHCIGIVSVSLRNSSCCYGWKWSTVYLLIVNYFHDDY